jgi:hypothetical protein
MSVDPALLAKLVCPATRTPLRYDPDAKELVSDAAGLAYPVRDGVPVMLIEQARRLGSGCTVDCHPRESGDPTPPPGIEKTGFPLSRE